MNSTTPATATAQHRALRRDATALRERLTAAEAVIASADDPHSLAALEAGREAEDLRLDLARVGAAMKLLEPTVEAERAEAAAAATRTFAPRHLAALAAVRAAALAYEAARRDVFAVHAESAQAGASGAMVMPRLPELDGVVESIDHAAGASPRAAA